MTTRILIADDSAPMRAALRSLLGRQGWEVLEAENGAEALAKAQEVKPDLIILDLAMPMGDGLTVSRKVASLLPNTPILMYTMYFSPQLDIEARKFGIRKMVAKPESTALVSAIRELLPSETRVDTAIPDLRPLAPIAESVGEGSLQTSPLVTGCGPDDVVH